MTYSHEASHDHPVAIPDSHFDRLTALSHLSPGALEGVIAALRAKEHTGQAEEDSAPRDAQDQEALLIHYGQEPEATQEQQPVRPAST
jgi:hypothetical protein